MLRSRFIISSIKNLIKNLPGFNYLGHLIHNPYFRFRLLNATTEEIFTYKIRKRKKEGSISLSGTGSDLFQTRAIIHELPKLFEELKIKSILDIPCGDFYWMKTVDLKGIDYIGADIVKKLVQTNKDNYENDKVSFRHLNIISDELPSIDLIICRDCFIHFCFEDTLRSICNISRNASEYILTTTFPHLKENYDIYTGQFRPLNLEVPPFNFSAPLRIINEGCTESNGAFSDKSLGLWRIKDLKKIVRSDFSLLNLTALFSDRCV